MALEVKERKTESRVRSCCKGNGLRLAHVTYKARLDVAALHSFPEIDAVCHS